VFQGWVPASDSWEEPQKGLNEARVGRIGGEFGGELRRLRIHPDSGSHHIISYRIKESALSLQI
jgi:hypothetical protein